MDLASTAWRFGLVSRRPAATCWTLAIDAFAPFAFWCRIGGSTIINPHLRAFGEAIETVGYNHVGVIDA